MTVAPLAGPVEESRRICDEAREAGVALRVLGGVGVSLHCSGSASRELLAEREHGDVDLVGSSDAADALEPLFHDLGYEPKWTFNRLHKGDGRLMFLDQDNERRVDVFLDRFSMCHELELAERLGIDFPTLSLADLLLTKLQVVEITAKDLIDMEALLTEHPVGAGDEETIDLERIASVCSVDWGWYRTATGNLQRLISGDHRQQASKRASELMEHIDEAPKGRRWRLRAKLGERVPWYQLPEDV
jgi:hypothetical protein